MSSRSSHTWRTLATNFQAKQDRFSPHACKLFGGRRGRGGGETFAARLEPGTQSQKMRNASESVCPNVWRWCKRTSWLNAAKQAISANLTLCYKRKKHALGLPSGGWWMNWLTRAICSLVTKSLEMQGLQRVPCRHTVQILEQKHFCVLWPCAADVISHFKNKKSQHINASTDNSVCSKTGFPIVSSRVDQHINTVV